MRAERIALTLATTLALAFAALAFANEYPIEITEVETKDLAGVTRATFSRGEVVVVETELYGVPGVYYAPTGTSYLEIIELFYGARVMGITLTRDAIMPGETKTFGGGVSIRTTDPTGTYDVEVYVWNGFPSEMGANWAPLAEMRTASITVTP